MGRLWRYAKLNDHHDDDDDDEQYKQQHRNNSSNKKPDKVDNCKEFQEVCWHIIFFCLVCFTIIL